MACAIRLLDLTALQGYNSPLMDRISEKVTLESHVGEQEQELLQVCRTHTATPLTGSSSRKSHSP